MKINYIFGVSSSGKSTYIYKQIDNALKTTEKNLILIVPEQITYEKEKELIDKLNLEGIMRIQILSFTRLQYKILEEVGGIKEKEINNYGKIMLLREIFELNKEKLKVFSKAYKKEGFLKNFNQLTKEFKENKVDIKSLKDIEKKEFENYGFDRKLEDINLIYSQLETKLQNTYVDNEDKKLLFINNINKSQFLENSIIYIDEFSAFSVLQIEIIKELLSISKELYLTLPIDKKNSEEIEREEFKISLDALNKINNKIEGLNPLVKEIQLKRGDVLKDDIDFLERNFFKYFPKKYKKEPKNINVFYGLNPYEEVEIVADEIIKELQEKKIKYKDIGIVLGDELAYMPIISKVFKEYEIPYFADYKKNIMDNNFVIYLMSFLDCIIYNYKREDVFRLLKSGYWDYDYEEIEELENYAIKWGIERSRWFKEFTIKDDEDNLERLNEIREKILNILPNKKIFKGKNKIENIVSILCKELEKLEFKNKISNNTELFREKNLYEEGYINNQIWNSIMELFEQINNILGYMETDIKEFKKILESGLMEFEIGTIPPKVDSVMIGSLNRTRHGSKDIIFVLGTNDGYLPTIPEDNGILADEERDLLKLEGFELRDRDFLIDTEKNNFYKLISKAQRKIFFSYSLGDLEGSALTRSIYIDKIKEIFPRIKIKSSLDEGKESKLNYKIKPALNKTLLKVAEEENINNLQDTYIKTLKWFLEKDENFKEFLKEGLLYSNNKELIDDDFINKLYDNPLSLTPYSLETYSQCPFKFFVEYGLKPVERREYKVDKRDIGTIYHKSLEKFTKNIIHNTKDNIDLQDGLKIMEESVKEAIKEEDENNSPMDYTYRNKYLKKKINRVVKESAKGIINQINKSEFKPSYYELSFSENSNLKPIEIKLNNNRTILIKGRMDRVDIGRNNEKAYVNIIDYKSKNEKIDFSYMAEGMKLQLFIYLDALLKNSDKLIQEDMDIGGVFYFNISLPKIDGDKFKNTDDKEKEILKKLKLEGFFIEDIDIIKKFDKDIEEKRDSTIAKIRLNKDDTVSKTSQTLNDEAFAQVMSFVKIKVKEIGENIIAGKIKIKPYKKNNEVPCTWCLYKSICQFDKSFQDNEYNVIYKVDKHNFNEIFGRVGDNND